MRVFRALPRAKLKQALAGKIACTIFPALGLNGRRVPSSQADRYWINQEERLRGFSKKFADPALQRGH